MQQSDISSANNTYETFSISLILHFAALSFQTPSISLGCFHGESCVHVLGVCYKMTPKHTAVMSDLCWTCCQVRHLRKEQRKCRRGGVLAARFYHEPSLGWAGNWGTGFFLAEDIKETFSNLSNYEIITRTSSLYRHS